jgi:tRNA uridine 5-carboxymethylaminomethyl modification enzyme
MKNNEFDAIVVGAGHAGVEAIRVLSARGHTAALITLDLSKIGAMSCNPAIGGVAKSHLVYEIDALGGLMGFTADLSAIQSRRLNMRKGPAVRSTRLQCDKGVYSYYLSYNIPKLKGISVISGEAAELVFERTTDGEQRIVGVRLKDGALILAKSVVVTAGTFMRGLMFCGHETQSGGRYGDTASDLLTESILRSGHRINRLKTGTPARLDSRTIDFSVLQKQWGDPEKRRFSWKSSHARLPQLACYMTYTNDKTHEIIRKNFDKSPLFSGQIQGVGPRYCPSVEDKIKRFSDRSRHQIFLEPEGLNTNSIYPNGLSTSLPADVQLEFLRSIVGLERVELLRPGYAVEYDTIDPTELRQSFMSKHVEGLFFAGQVNRTSGYEEAAAQGLWAGMNSSLYICGEETLKPDRSRSYLETLVDDLTSVGSEEPYRMFTSRSEYRLLLREDNAHDRLFDLGSSLGLISEDQKRFTSFVSTETLNLKSRLLNEKLRLDESRVISMFEYLKRPEVCWEDLSCELLCESGDVVFDLALEKIEIDAKYSGYLVKQERELEQLRQVQSWRIDLSVDLSLSDGLSKEVLEKISILKPKNIAELSKISGITPAAVLSVARVAGRKKGETVSRETFA